MSGSSPQSDQRFLELLAGQTLNNLSTDEQQEMAALPMDSVASLRAEFDRVAAAVLLTDSDQQNLQPLPSHLATKIIAAAPSHLLVTGNANAVPRKDVSHLAAPMINSGVRRRELIAWLCAAASIAGLLGQWIWNDQSRFSSPPSDVMAQRDRLLDDDVSVIRISWAPGTTPFSVPVTGDVVWSESTQTGFLRFVSMPVNDPTVEQYQLWIIDPKRDDEPIDGGVFDISETGEVIVPIDAKLRVLEPAAFAITIEKPGGVVVSTQSRLPLIAAVKS